MRSWNSKPAFKLHFGKRDKARRIAGMKALILNNMVDDPTLVRESLGYEVFRALQLPAPRSGFAEVRVNGQRFGLYALIEPVEESLLARSFKSTAVQTSTVIVTRTTIGCTTIPKTSVSA